MFRGLAQSLQASSVFYDFRKEFPQELTLGSKNLLRILNCGIKQKQKEKTAIN
jgi:hypothetical protein